MITSGFGNLLKQVINSGGTSKGLLPIKDVSGTVRYLADYTYYPYSVVTSFTTNQSSAGISVGYGIAEPDENDYQLAHTITSGLTGTVTVSKSVDEYGNAVSVFEVSIENTGQDSITISEIGYKQNISASDTQNGTTTHDYVFLVDRTKLASSISVAPNAQAIIRYSIYTKITSGGGARMDTVRLMGTNIFVPVKYE